MNTNDRALKLADALLSRLPTASLPGAREKWASLIAGEITEAKKCPDEGWTKTSFFLETAEALQKERDVALLQVDALRKALERCADIGERGVVEIACDALGKSVNRNAAPLFFCNKCGWSGPKGIHPDCNYEAAAVPFIEKRNDAYRQPKGKDILGAIPDLPEQPRCPTCGDYLGTLPCWKCSGPPQDEHHCASPNCCPPDQTR